MRRACLTFPWLRMYEYNRVSAGVTLEVEHENENCLAFVKIKEPEALPLLELDRMVTAAREKPME